MGTRCEKNNDGGRTPDNAVATKPYVVPTTARPSPSLEEVRVHVPPRKAVH